MAQTARRAAWRRWRHSRPFSAGLLLVLGGLELICVCWSGLGLLRFTGAAGAASWTLGALLVVAGVTTWRNPDLRHFAGTLAAVLSLVSLVAANLGGLLVGFGLTAVGSALALAWIPQPPVRQRSVT
ncbi:hypothetical protein J2Z21_000540 [Streptomyces griseochromogenes]|uniref:Integral membrane protein n=1 Tax=Streptomyces griseochromogenes TaxID=68214 RepID=A0A1B1B2C2_9ACTN|nr:DUF6114 domain-containing protein [Streptomyces griseochromogenes]ANP52967.1 hypothetical protein AVL59_28545 [Streptomyces griseochromogenes]MBP2047618.1 hypothetical protein [Streptomyces griseochromogenes]